ncbi:MAG: FliH/SctL family protein [Terriglobia bacterium]
MSSKIIRPESAVSRNVATFSFHTLPKKENAATRPLVVPGAPPSSDLKVELGSPVEDATGQDTEALIRQAQLKASEIEKEAYEKGFAEGQKAGQLVGENSIEALLRQYAKSLEELRRLRKDVFVLSEREVIRLALEVAKKLIKREVVIDEELIVTLVKVALSRAADQTILLIKVNPKDFLTLQRCQSMPSNGIGEGIRIVEDPMMSRGSLVIETESGLIDARIEEQLKEIEKGFLE